MVEDRLRSRIYDVRAVRTRVAAIRTENATHRGVHLARRHPVHDVRDDALQSLDERGLRVHGNHGFLVSAIFATVDPGVVQRLRQPTFQVYVRNSVLDDPQKKNKCTS